MINVKKFACFLLSIMMCLSIAFADCQCQVPDDVCEVVEELIDMNIDITSADMTKLVLLCYTDKIDCHEAKKILFDFMIEYDVYAMIDDHNMLMVLRNFITDCCCDQMINDVKPERKEENSNNNVHSHRGGTHENGGKCSSCGVVYQTHKVNWACIDHSQNYHTEKCTCGWTGQTQKHQAGELIRYEGSNLALYRCVVCNAELHWHILRDYERQKCCDCHAGVCCENCGCGCTCS